MKKIALLVAAAALSACAADGGMEFPRLAERTGAAAASPEAVHERVFTLDSHIDIPVAYATHEYDPGSLTRLRNDLPKMRAGGLDGAFFIIYAPQGELTEEGYARAREIAETRWRALDRTFGAYADQIGLARTADEAEEIARSGRIVAFIGMENAYPLGASLEDLPMWVDRGVRYVSATHFGHNQFADSSNFDTESGEPESLNGGLSPLGRDLIAALNRAGVMVDVSHTGRESVMQAVELSVAPVIASHSNARALADNVRNLDDEQIRAIAATGGVIQTTALHVYLREPTPERVAALEEIRERYGAVTFADRRNLAPEVAEAYYAEAAALDLRMPIADVGDLIDHIDYIVELVGIDHVGISSDFDGGGGIEGWRDASETANVTRALLERGYSEAEIEQIWSGNLLRVMREVEQVARALQAGE